METRKTIRFSESELKELEAAMETTNEQWRGISHFVREATLEWARRKNSARRVRAMADSVGSR